MHLPAIGMMTQQRKQSHDDEKSRPCRIDNDAGCDLRTCICRRGRIVHPGLARSDRPLGPATATRLQCFLSGDGDADGRDQCAPLSWRTEIERLTSSSLPCCKLTSPGKRAGETSVRVPDMDPSHRKEPVAPNFAWFETVAARPLGSLLDIQAWNECPISAWNMRR
jgi:hypothetical protein